jgi:hypothetical protein
MVVPRTITLGQSGSGAARGTQLPLAVKPHVPVAGSAQHAPGIATATGTGTDIQDALPQGTLVPAAPVSDGGPPPVPPYPPLPPDPGRPPLAKLPPPPPELERPAALLPKSRAPPLFTAASAASTLRFSRVPASGAVEPCFPACPVSDLVSAEPGTSGDRLTVFAHAEARHPIKNNVNNQRGIA